jgi:plasmid stability protein
MHVTTRKRRMTTLQVRNFNDDLHYALKIEAARARTSLRELVEEAVRRELERREHQRERQEARGRQEPRP